MADWPLTSSPDHIRGWRLNVLFLSSAREREFGHIVELTFITVTAFINADVESC